MLLLFNIYAPVWHQNGIVAVSIQAKVDILFTVRKDFSFWYQELKVEIAVFSTCKQSKKDIKFSFIQCMK